MLCLTRDGTVSNNTFDGNIYVLLKTILIMTRIKNYRSSRQYSSLSETAYFLR